MTWMVSTALSLGRIFNCEREVVSYSQLREKETYSSIEVLNCGGF